MQNTTHRLVDASSGAALGRLAGLASDAPSTSSRRVSRGQDVHCCVLVAVVTGLALGTIPLTNGQRQSFNDVPANVAPFAGREETINEFDLLPIPLGFILQHPTEFSEGRIRKASSEMVIANHTTHVQIFDAKHVESANECGRHFVQVIGAGVRNSSVELRNSESRSFSPIAPFCPPREHALCSSKLLLESFSALQVRNALAVRESSQPGNSKIDPNCLSGLGQSCDPFIENQRHEVASRRVLGYRHRRRATREGPRPTNLESTKLGEGQRSGFRIPLESRPSVFGSLFVSLPFERGEAATFLKKVTICSLKVPERLLGRNTRNLVQPNMLGRLFELGQCSR